MRRELRRVILAVVGAAGMIGAAVGWLVSRLVTHLLHEGRSSHRR